MDTRWRRALLLLVLGFFLVVLPVMGLFGLFRGGARLERGRTAVVVDVRGSMLEYRPSFSAGVLFDRGEVTQFDLLDAIERAARDGRVEALIVRIFPSAAGWAKCEELHRAIVRFREAGKRAIAFSPVLVNQHYLVACACDSIVMPPSGYLVVSGPASSAVFVRGTLDKLGVTPNIHRIGEYKSAPELFTERERTPASCEMAEWLLGDLYERFVETAASDRGIGEDTVRALIDRGLFGPRRAREARLIDRVCYWDEIGSAFERERIELIEMRPYLKSALARRPAAPRVAVVHAQGRIVMGEAGFDWLDGMSMGSDAIVRALRTAREDGRIDAVVLRIDSPGGDGIAGEMISREVELTAGEKPVVVSMSDVAASGGYEIAYRADRLVALPGTVTGSIGSIIGKMNARRLYNRIGVTKDEIGIGERALLFSDYRDFSAGEWEVIKEEHWDFYRAWIADIARCRGMSEAEVDSLGRGRVWTGSQAQSRGLIDEVGGFDRALELACELAGIEDPSRVVLVHLPERLSLLQALLSGRFFADALSYTLHGALVRTVANRAPLLDREL